MGEEKVSLDYEREYHRVLREMTEMEKQYEEKMQNNSEFYEQALKQKR